MKIKKNLLLPVIVSLAVLAVPLLTAAQEPASGCMINQDLRDFTNISCPDASGGGSYLCEFDSTTYDCAMCCTINTIVKVTNWIFVGVASISAIMVLVGGYFMVTTGGDPQKFDKGKSYIQYAIIGFIVAILANAIPGAVRSVLGL